MIDDPAAGAHAAAGKNNGRALGITELEMIAVAFHRIEPVEIDGMVSTEEKIPGFLIPIFGKLRINLRYFKTQRGIHEHRWAFLALKRGKHFLADRIGKKPVHFVDQFLGAAQGESRNKDLSAIRQ